MVNQPQNSAEPLKDDVVLTLKNKEVILKLKYLQNLIDELEEEKNTYKEISQEL